MKRGLEGLVRQTKKILATSLTALALYAPSQEAIKLETTNDSWNEKTPATLVYQKTLGLKEKGYDENPANLFKTEVYFSGKGNTIGTTEFSYSTTDLNSPQINAAVVDNSKTKLYFIADSGITAEVIYQEIKIMNSRGEIDTEYSTPKEKACSTLMKLGINLLETTDEKVRSYVNLKTGGLVNLGIKEALTDYCESQTKTIGERARQTVNPELVISEIPLEIRDSNFAFREKEVGRSIGLRFFSQTRGAQGSQSMNVPISIFYHLSMKRNGEGNTYKAGNENEFGEIEAYTGQFKAEAKEIATSATQLKTTETSQMTPEKKLDPEDRSRPSDFSGFWKCERNNEVVSISHSGKVFFIDPRQIRGEILIPEIARKEKEIKVNAEGYMFHHELKSNLDFKLRGIEKIEPVNKLDENTIRIENLRGNSPGEKETLTRLPEWDIIHSIMEGIAPPSPTIQVAAPARQETPKVTQGSSPFSGTWMSERKYRPNSLERIIIVDNEIFKMTPLISNDAKRSILRIEGDSKESERGNIYELCLESNSYTRESIPVGDIELITPDMIKVNMLFSNSEYSNIIGGNWLRYDGLGFFNLTIEKRVSLP